jgi:uncharacterized protein DUF1360
MNDERSGQLLLACAATWRVTHLLAAEDGPSDVVVLLRGRLGQSFLGQLMDCFLCLSLWIAAPVAFRLSRGPRDWLLVWLGLSGAACLLERCTEERIHVQPLRESEESNELLR